MTYTADASGSDTQGIKAATEYIAAKTDSAIVPPTAAAVAAAANFATGRTIEVVQITQAAAGYAILSHNAAGKAIALHKLYGHMSVAGTVQVTHDTNGAGGGTPVVLVGAMNVAATGKVDLDFGPNPAFCPATTAVADRHLNVLSVTGAFNGVAVISYAT